MSETRNQISALCSVAQGPVGPCVAWYVLGQASKDYQEVAQHKYTDMKWPNKLIHRLSDLVHASVLEEKLVLESSVQVKNWFTQVVNGIFTEQSWSSCLTVALCWSLLAWHPITATVSLAQFYVSTLTHDWVEILDKYQLVLHRFAGERSVNYQLLILRTYYAVQVPHL